jgi:hypothetical protein
VDGVREGENVMGSFPIRVLVGGAKARHPAQRARREANQPAQRQVGARDKAWFALDSPLEEEFGSGDGFARDCPLQRGVSNEPCGCGEFLWNERLSRTLPLESAGGAAVSDLARHGRAIAAYRRAP